MNSRGFILPNTDANSTVFDFLVIFCSSRVYSLVPGVWHPVLDPIIVRTPVYSLVPGGWHQWRLFDRISTYLIACPSLDALLGTFYLFCFCLLRAVTNRLLSFSFQIILSFFAVYPYIPLIFYSVHVLKNYINL